MQIRRIEISAFRCFKNSLVIEDIGDGVTLFVGDNEEGKSTVLAALQTVLFEKHNVGGIVADAMLPYGSKVQPEIKLEFDHNGERYRLYKAFCQRPVANLEAASGNRWSDDAAEERLREMLEFTPPGKGGAKAEHRGLQALFWVEQGSASAQPHINETAQTSLASVLETEIGTVTGGERGRILIKRIESRVNEISTSKTRKPAGAYRDAITRATAARGRRDELAARLKEFEGKIDALTREQMQTLLLKVWRRTGKQIVLVTHDIEEAVFLASDLVMLSARPARVASRLALDFGQRYAAGEPARRIKSDPAFIDQREQVLSWLFEQGERGDG